MTEVQSFKGSAEFDETKTQPENKNKFLIVLIDPNLSFEEHINNIYKKVSQKLNALSLLSLPNLGIEVSVSFRY